MELTAPLLKRKPNTNENQGLSLDLASMAAANVGWINYAEPGPIDTSVLTQQANHRSEAIWNRIQGPLPVAAVV
nr:hypothetical protein CFP56_55090 [Quercus suber]